MSRYRVVEAYESVYPDPIILIAGEKLEIGDEDVEYPGWVWCTNGTGKSGWVPLSCIDRSAACALYDYSANELTASEGEEIAVHKVENGWAWSTSSRGEQGWIPIANIEQAA